MTLKFKCDGIKTSITEGKRYINFSSVDENVPGNLNLVVTVGSPTDVFEQGEQFFITFEDVIE